MEISHQTKITIGLAITIASVIFSAGYFYAKQDALQSRVQVLEMSKEKTDQMFQDVGIIKARLEMMENKLDNAIIRWDKHIDNAKN